MKPIEPKIEKLSVEQKASMLSGMDFWQSRGIEEADIPPMFLADGPHGVRRQAEAADHLGLNASLPATCYPTAATLANSWDKELAEQMGRFLGTEAASQQVSILLGPGLNIKRNPRCGRNFEYFSEDPILSGRMAAALVRGIQSVGISACVKHFVANNQETRRMTIDSVIDERTLREIYLTGFEIAVKEGKAKALMSAYNRINGHWANEHPYLLRDILRKEWGFDGIVVSDWGGSNERVEGLKAGNELEMPGTAGQSDREVVEAVRAGLIDESLLDESVSRLAAIARTTRQAVENAPKEFDKKAHHEMSCRVAEQSVVLLKNEESILPLSSDVKVAVIGDFAKNPRYQGAGSSNVNPTMIDNTLEALSDSGINSIGYEPGFRRYGQKSNSLQRKALKLAAKADVVLLYIGLDEVTEAEGLDRANIELPQNQIELIEALNEVNSNIVAVLSCGAVIEMPWLDKVSGLVHGYLGGQGVAHAVLKVLDGRVNPSGKLAESYPERYESCSSAANFPGGELTVEYREGPFVGYRYYDKYPSLIRFPFGFGLSYTNFSYSDLRVDENGVSFTLTNTGDRAGAEVVQLYISKGESQLFRPEKELKGFTKVFLEAGLSSQVTIPFDEYSFRYFDTEAMKWLVEDGEYRIMLGSSSADIRLEAAHRVTGVEPQVTYDRQALHSYFGGNPALAGSAEFEHLLGRPLPEASWDRSQPLEYNSIIDQCKYAKGFAGRFTSGMLGFAHWFLWRIGKRELANLLTMSFLNMPFRGIAKMMGGAVNRPMAGGLLLAVNGKFFKGISVFFKEMKKSRKEQ